MRSARQVLSTVRDLTNTFYYTNRGPEHRDPKKVFEGIAALSLPVVMMAKECVNRAFETTLAEGVRFERRMFHATFALEDQKEGMAAFVEKRQPAFKHQ